jgi:DNA-binding transcriptional regulator YdaS (Cro superfamily)
MDSPSPIDRAIALAGSQARLGEATGFSQPAINKAKRRGHVSAEMALAIHRFTAGAVAASELRPDLWSRAEETAATPSPTARRATRLTVSFPESASLPADRRSPPTPPALSPRRRPSRT